MTPSRYLKVIFGLMLGTALSIGLFNWAVDPYMLFHSPEIDGFNRYKTDLYKHTRLSVAHNLWDASPENLLVGSSRVHFGFDTTAPFPDGNHYFNVGLLGISMYEMTRYLQHAESRQPVRRLLIGLDMFMFNRHVQINESFSEARLAVTPDDQFNNVFWTTSLRDKFQALFTYDALQTSVRTVAKQSLANKYGIGGFEGEAISLARDVKKHGPRTAFHRVQGEYPEKWCPQPLHTFELGDSNDPKSPLGQYRALLRLAHQRQTELHLFITPSHAYLWEAMDRTGLWPTFEEWKRALVRINEEEATRAGRPAYPLWDFSGYNPYTTEDVPEQGSTNLMQWYWEASHFRPALGEKVVSRIFHTKGEEADFGNLMRSDNIEQHLSNIRSSRERYRTSHKEDMREINTLGINPTLCHQ
jgi:hypothetical protein